MEPPPAPVLRRETTSIDEDDVPPPPPCTPAQCRAACVKLRKHIWACARELLKMPDVWAKHALEQRPAQRIRRHRFDPETQQWRVDASLIKIAPALFDEGAMRRCFRAKKLSFGYVRRFHALDWKKAPNFVVKSYKTEGDASRAFDDVRLQAEASLYADKFNQLKPPKPIHVIAACVLELVDDQTTPALCAERFIDGADRFGRGFIKHNNNSGFVDHDEHRSTPQAFSAYSFYASEGDVLVCDIQGVDDLYTDPQLHSADESRGKGDLGRRGMALFFATVDAEATKGLFEPLGIPQFELSPAERRRASDQDEEPQKGSSVRFTSIPDKSTQSRHDEARRLSIMGARRVRLEAQKSLRTLGACAEENAELCDDGKCDATAMAAKTLLDEIDESASGTPRTSYKVEIAVAEVHSALARLECEARWTANSDVYSALFHCAIAARHSPSAAYALARFHRGLDHPILPLPIDAAKELRDEARAGSLLLSAAAGGHNAAKASFALAALDDASAQAIGLVGADLNVAEQFICEVFEDREGSGGAATEAFAVGDAVEANYGGEGHWYPGRVASVTSDIYEIAYDDGEAESGVPPANVRRAASADDGDDATAVEPAKEDDNTALPLPLHELFAAVAAASSDATKATPLYEKAAALALKGSALKGDARDPWSAGVYLGKAAALE